MNKKTKHLKLLVRADGSKWIGMGHLTRTFETVNELKKHVGVELLYLVKNYRAALKYLEQKELPFRTIPTHLSKTKEHRAVASVIKSWQPDVILVDDLNNTFDRKYLRANVPGGEEKLLVAYCDSTIKRTLDADIAVQFNPNQQTEFYSRETGTDYYVGLRHFITPDVYRRKNTYKVRKSIRTVTVCMGGSDRRNVTFRVLKALNGSVHDFEIYVILSSSFFDREIVKEFTDGLRKKVYAFYDTKNIYDFLKKADIAVTSGGNVHIERLILGVPGLVVCQSQRENEIANRINKDHVTVNLGTYKDAREKDILKAFDAMVCDYEGRQRMSKNGRRHFDAKGVSRITEAILEKIKT